VTHPAGRVLGVDLGSRRIGLALSDPLRVLAVPLEVLMRTGDPAADHAAILRAAVGNEAGLIVVGVPLSLSTGRPGPAAQAALAEVAELAHRAAALDPPVPVLLPMTRDTVARCVNRHFRKASSKSISFSPS